MLCSTCGTKVRFRRGTFICTICNAEHDILDFHEELIPEPVFVPVQLLAFHYAIIDTRRQTVYAVLDSSDKAQLISRLPNKNLAETKLNKQLEKYR